MIKSIHLIEEYEGNTEQGKTDILTEEPDFHDLYNFKNSVPDDIKPHIYLIQTRLNEIGYRLNQSYLFGEVKSLLDILSTKEKQFNFPLLLHIYDYFKISLDKPANLLEIFKCIFSTYKKTIETRNKLSKECLIISNRYKLFKKKLLKLKSQENHISSLNKNKSMLYLDLNYLNGFDKENEVYYLIIKNLDNSSLLELELNLSQQSKRNKITSLNNFKEGIKITIWKFDQIDQHLTVIYEEVQDLKNHLADKVIKKHIVIRNNLSLGIEFLYIDYKLYYYQGQVNQLTYLKEKIISEINFLDNDLKSIEGLDFDKEFLLNSKLENSEIFSTHENINNSISSKESISEYLIRNKDLYHNILEKAFSMINILMFIISVIISFGKFDVNNLILTIFIMGIEYNYISNFELRKILFFTYFCLLYDIIWITINYKMTNLYKTPLKSDYQICILILSSLSMLLKTILIFVIGRLSYLYQYKRNNSLIDYSLDISRVTKFYDFNKDLKQKLNT